ncbi:MAG TPA: tRNA pseudouridine(38-40) synthase TruA [Clostridiaceae bacterium]|nr:tRNA pseudouridine(38-40) synthase TruA [Clostridiaceae bacterium]
MNKNIALKISYDGSCFHGWQLQKNAYTVQQAMQDGWAELTGEKINIIGSSRTDAGVHATGLVANFKTSAKIPTDRIHLALNTVLPAGVSVIAAKEVARDFNARFDAQGKHYSYFYYHSTAKPSILRNFTAHISGEIDLQRMQDACVHFIGEKDFAALADQGTSVNTTVREILRLQIAEYAENIIRLDVVGTGFLYHMIRILAGTLFYIGSGKIDSKDIPEYLESKDRTLMGKTMPAQGLFLNKVFYPKVLFGQDGLMEFYDRQFNNYI